MRELLAKSLEQSKLSQGKSAALAIRRGWPVESLGQDFAISSCIPSLERRLSHVLSMRGEHAKELAVSLQEYLDVAKLHPAATGQEYLFTGETNSFVIFATNDGVCALSCLRLVGRSQVADEPAWHLLWHDGA